MRVSELISKETQRMLFPSEFKSPAYQLKKKETAGRAGTEL